MYEFFVQDGWKATRKLHLDYGLRYTVIQPYYSLWRNMSVFDIASYDPAKAVQQNPKTGYIIPGTGDIYNGLIIPASGWTDEAKGRFPASTDPQYDRLVQGRQVVLAISKRTSGSLVSASRTRSTTRLSFDRASGDTSRASA